MSENNQNPAMAAALGKRQGNGESGNKTPQNKRRYFTRNKKSPLTQGQGVEKVQENTTKTEPFYPFKTADTKDTKDTHRKQVQQQNPRRNYVKNHGGVKIIPLGGIGEVGKNITAYEYEDELFLVDCGLIFPEAELFGVDLVIPDFTYLRQNKHKIKAVVLTHGHEDHIGALPYFLKEFNVPVYGTKFTLGLVEHKLKEHRILKNSTLNPVSAGSKIKIGPFEIEFINVNHSIPDAMSVAITTPVGLILQTGDFKIDYSPINEPIMDLIGFAKQGAKGVKLLLSDSTNAEREGHTASESSVGPSFERIFANNKDKRILVATFASNVYRVQQIITLALKTGRKVAVSGRSMENITEIAHRLGYLKAPESIFIDLEQANRLRPEQVVVVTTGSQGEPMAALSRMANGTHKKLRLNPDDCVIISAKPVPGNEKSVSKLINDLLKSGANVVYDQGEKIHVSGHGSRDELSLMLNLTKPEFFLPVHGEFRQLRQHSFLAQQSGVSPENILIGTIGNVFELTEDSFRMIDTVPAGRVFVDGLGVGDVGSVVLKDRKHLSEDGLIVVVITVDSQTGQFSSTPDIVSRGFVYVKESETLMRNTKDNIKTILGKCEEENIKEWSAIKIRVRESLSHMIYQKTRRNPMILPIITEI